MVDFPTSVFDLDDFTAAETLDQAHGGFGHVESHNAFVDEIAAAQTKIGTGASTPGTAGYVLTATSATESAYQAPVTSNILKNKLAADVNLNNTANYFDGPSVTLTVGTWDLVGAVHVQDTAGIANIAAKLWNGTTVESSGEVTISAATYGQMIPLGGTVTVASGTETWKISCRDATSTSGKILSTTVLVGTSGANASWLKAVRIA